MISIIALLKPTPALGSVRLTIKLLDLDETNS